MTGRYSHNNGAPGFQPIADDGPFHLSRLVLEGHERCRKHLLPTPLEHSLHLSDRIGSEVWLKLDSMQRTSSFKFRGAPMFRIRSRMHSLTQKGLWTVYLAGQILMCCVLFLGVVNGPGKGFLLFLLLPK